MKDSPVLYDRFCSLYDVLFSALLSPGRQEVMHKINALPPSHILEIGIGTGLSLGHYRPVHRVTGIDISPKMMEKALQRMRRLRIRNARLMQMDAEKLAFADNSFDAVVALYVVSATANPGALMSEANRVCRRGGRIFIVNHFSQPSTVTAPVATIEKSLLPLTRWLGWKSYFERRQIAFPNLRLVDRKKTNLFGYWQLLEYECTR